MSIKVKLVAMFFAVSIITAVIIGASVSIIAGSIMADEYERSTKEVNQQIVVIFEEYFNNYERLLGSLSDSRLFDKPSSTEQNFREVMQSYIKNNDDLLNIYFASADRRMYLEAKSGVVTPRTYDPTGNAWYIEVKTKEEVMWNGPVKDDASNETVMELRQPVYNKRGQFIGVAGATVRMTKLTDIVNNTEFGKTGYAFLTDKNAEVLVHRTDKIIGLNVVDLNETLYNAIVNNKVYCDYQWQEADGRLEDKIAVITEIPRIGWNVVGTAYLEDINESISYLYKLALIIGLLTGLLGVLISYTFANKLTKAVRRLDEGMGELKEGNFSYNVEIKRNDELGRLGTSFNAMTENVRGLIKQVQEVSTSINASAESLASISEETLATAEEIGAAVEEISRGASAQASESETGVALITDLDQQLELLKESSGEMHAKASVVIEANELGQKKMSVLNTKTEENNYANNEVEKVILTLAKKTEEISSILQTIKSIAAQTNLLALNASIEAARAGEAGRGFAVVAEEIRKLAEDSNKAADHISHIVKDIEDESGNSVAMISEVKYIMDDQATAVNEVNGGLGTITNSITEISDTINLVSCYIEEINQQKVHIVDAIENISGVSEETAASTEEVTASIAQQNIAVEEVTKSADQLNDLARRLNKEVEAFRI